MTVKSRKSHEDRTAFDRRMKKEAGVRLLCGVDEAGRGPLAGPVVAAAVVMPARPALEDVRDSKKLTEKKRFQVRDRILEICRDHAFGVVSAAEIDEINILQASLRAMKEAVDGLKQTPQLVLADGNRAPGCPMPVRAVVKGDDRSYAIAAASILAKCRRDEMMFELHEAFPQYGFARHKGYGTRAHLRSLEEHGPIPEHRRTFAPVARALGRETARPGDG